MKTKMKKGFGIMIMYGVAIVLTLLLSNRMERLESREEIQNQTIHLACQLK